MKTNETQNMKRPHEAFMIAFIALIIATGDLAAGPAIYNTGVDNNNQQLAGGSLDPHYQMRQLTGGNYIGNTNWTNAVVMNNSITWGEWLKPSDARWIYVTDAANLGQDWGTYEFMTTFNLSGYDPSTAVLAGKCAVDQNGTIFLNGNLVATLPDGNWNNNLTSFSLNSGFLPGLNTLTFRVRFPDGGDGMIMSGTSLSATPLPKLAITANREQFTVAWSVSATNYVLESTTNLSTQNWVTNVGAITLNSTNYYYGTNLGGSLFFRLKK